MKKPLHHLFRWAVIPLAVATVVSSAGGAGAATPGTSSALITPAYTTTPTTAGETFWSTTWTATEGQDIKTLLTGSLDGSADLYVDDVMRIDVSHADGGTTTHTQNFNTDGECGGVVPVEALDVSKMLEPGINTITVTLSDLCDGGGEGSSDIYITGRGEYGELTWVPSPAPVPECSAGTSSQWAHHSYVSEEDGLVLDNATLNGRMAVRAMQVPYLNVALSVGDADKLYRVQLRPDGQAQADGLVSRIDEGSFKCDDHLAQAVYTVTGFPGGFELRVTQSYRFADIDPEDRCEPSGQVSCARFWPTLTWKTSAPASAEGVEFLSVGTAQRFDFRPDDAEVGAWMVGRDKPHAGSNLGLLHYPGTDEFTVSAIGGDDVNWDNYHQTAKSEVTMPGNTGSAGCAECVHMHWRWTTATNLGFKRTVPIGPVRLRPYDRDFTDGKPAILPGSPQKAQLTLVREHLDRDETQPQVAEALADGEPLEGGHPIVFWTTTSSGIKSPTGSYSDATFPYMPDNRDGDTGSLWFSPVAPTP